jgi:hypothetical protein
VVPKKRVFFILGLAGIFLSPLFFGPLSNLIQHVGPTWAAAKTSRIHHLSFWTLSLIWAVYFGIRLWKSDWNWFAAGNAKRKLGIILLTAGVVRLLTIFFVDLPLDPDSDEAQYNRMAVALVQTGVLEDGGTEPSYRPVGYVVFLAGLYKVFGPAVFLAKLANLFLNLWTLVLLWKIFSRWRDAETALKGVAIAAFYPPTVYTVQNLISEHLFVFLWVAGVYFWEKSRKDQKWPFLSGIFFGLSALVRPVVLAWGAVPVLMGLCKRRWLAVSAFVLAAALITAPWFYRNHKKFGLWALSTHAGLNFWMGANLQATSQYHLPDSLPFDFSDRGKMEKTAWKLGWEYVANHPLEYLWLGIRKEAVTFGFDYTTLFRGLERPPPHWQLIWGILGEAVWWILFFFAGLKGATLLLNRPKRGAAGSLLPLWTILCWVAIHFFFVGTDRFHHPLVPFFAYLAVLPLPREPEGDRLQVAEGDRPPVKN